jgi:hypothetical protein
VPTLLHVADALAHEVAPVPATEPPSLDEAHLEAAGLASSLPAWRAIASELAY